MNKKQYSKLASYRAALASLEAIPEIDSIPGLPGELAIFRTKMVEMLHLEQTQKEALAGKRIRRDELLDEMAEAAVEVATLVSAYADKQKLTELAPLVRVGPGDFSRTQRGARPVLARSVLDAARAVLPELGPYGVTAKTVGALEARITAALEGLHQPRSGVVERRTATTRIAALFGEIDGLLEGQIDKLVYQIRKTHPVAYSNYRAAREIVDRGSRGPRDTEAPSTTPVVPIVSEKQAA